MEYIKPKYKIKNVDIKELLFKFDFHKYNKDSLVHRFPIRKYKNKILVYGEFIIYTDDVSKEDYNMLHVNVFDNNGNSINYNKEEYGITDGFINKCVSNEINKFIKEGLISATN